MSELVSDVAAQGGPGSRSAAPSPMTSDARDLLVIARGFGPIHCEHIDGRYVGETARELVRYSITDGGLQQLEPPPRARKARP